MRVSESVLVIAEPFVEQSYPGGVRGLLKDQKRRHGSTQQLTCADQLVVVSNEDPEVLIATHHRLRAILTKAGGVATPCVFVDPVEGIMEACDWLSCAPLGDGSVELQYMGSTAELERSFEAASRCCVQDQLFPMPEEEPTLVRLSEKDGRITWLDTKTGRELVSASLPRPEADDADAPMPMLEAAASMLERRGWEFERDDDGDLSFRLNAGPLLAFSLRFIASMGGDTLILAIRLPGRVSVNRIADVSVYLAGANWGLEVGGFDIDLSSGEVIYRAANVAPDGLLRPTAAEIALDHSMHSATFYAAGLIEVARGADPRAVLARIEGT